MPAINPTPEQLEAFLAGAADETPIVMINLLRFHERAVYEPGSGAAPCSGREAYARYGAVAVHKVHEAGGRILWQGRVACSLIAVAGEEWDDAILVEYPSRQAFLTMVAQPDYEAAAVHRTAALADSRLIATNTLGSAFGS
jgi:uncharacterized protein (DUF1330 family)